MLSVSEIDAAGQHYVLFVLRNDTLISFPADFHLFHSELVTI